MADAVGKKMADAVSKKIVILLTGKYFNDVRGTQTSGNSKKLM